MANSRLEKIGTIYSRITGLLRAGAMKKDDRPIWYDVYTAFPPKVPPTFGRTIDYEPIRNIFYPEDKLRAIFHRKLRKLPAYNMSSSVDEGSDLTRTAISMASALLKDKTLSKEEAISKVIKQLQMEGKIQRRTHERKSTIEVKSIADDRQAKKEAKIAARLISTVEEPPDDSLAGNYKSAIKDIAERNVNVKETVKDE